MKIKPYGDTFNDGKVQLSFTLPVSKSAKGIATAKEIAKGMGLINPAIVHAEGIGDEFSFYIVYGSTKTVIDFENIKVEEITSEALSREEIEALIKKEFGRNIVFVGASTGTDAHTVGIDAIMNMKGFAGHYGLERYHGITAYNLGSQVTNEDFVKFAREKNADVLLVSQTVTQKEVHLKNMIDLVELLETEGLRDHIVLVAGGARISHSLAKELGYDAGFGPGNYAEDVATFAINTLINKRGEK
ncbi:MAG: OAM dimerization domain-containing protein [Candidatus Izemoplasmatales bacterium]|nr:OAM dimerization domain-containing protein [Candidatus Izemoplasmatales bacterium]